MKICTEVGKIDVSSLMKTATETAATNGVVADAQPEPSKVTSQPPEPQPMTNQSSAGNGEQLPEKPEPALEQLAKNLETIGKYRDMHNDVNEMDMIAFKVFTPNFEKSDYIIALVESIIGRSNLEQQDFDLTLQIMGKRIK